MTKIFIRLFSLVTILLIGCSTEMEPTEDPEEQVGTEQSGPESQKIMEEFRSIAKDSATPDVLIQFINQNIEVVITANADEMIDTLRYSLETNKQVYEEQIVELDTESELLAIDGSEAIFNESKIAEIQNSELKTAVQYLYSNMYKLINLEGTFYPIVDYSKLKEYNAYLSEELQSYIEIKSLESDNRSMVDGALTISFDELAERIYLMEDYLKIASSSERKNDILENYNYEINAYLRGLPNTPIMDDDTKEIKTKVLDSYKVAARQEYEISKIVTEYLTIIEENENIMEDTVLQKADELILKVLATFETI